MLPLKMKQKISSPFLELVLIIWMTGFLVEIFVIVVSRGNLH